MDHIPLLVSKTIGKNKSFHGKYLAENACSPIFLSLRRTHTIKVSGAYAQIHLAEWTGVILWPPPEHKMLRICPCLPDKFTRSIKETRDEDLLFSPFASHITF